jgi:hypothetical protein
MQPLHMGQAFSSRISYIGPLINDMHVLIHAVRAWLRSMHPRTTNG